MAENAKNGAVQNDTAIVERHAAETVEPEVKEPRRRLRKSRRKERRGSCSNNPDGTIKKCRRLRKRDTKVHSSSVILNAKAMTHVKSRKFITEHGVEFTSFS